MTMPPPAASAASRSKLRLGLAAPCGTPPARRRVSMKMKLFAAAGVLALAPLAAPAAAQHAAHGGMAMPMPPAKKYPPTKKAVPKKAARKADPASKAAAKQ